MTTHELPADHLLVDGRTAAAPTIATVQGGRAANANPDDMMRIVKVVQERG